MASASHDGALPPALIRDVFHSMAAQAAPTMAHTESYNHLLGTQMKRIVDERHRIPTVNGDGRVLIEVIITNVHIGPPFIREHTGQERTVTPWEAELRKKPYILPVVCNMDVRRYVNKSFPEPGGVWTSGVDPITGRASTTRIGSGDALVPLEALNPDTHGVSLTATNAPGREHADVRDAKDRARAVKWEFVGSHSASGQRLLELPAQLGSAACITSHMPRLNPNAGWYMPGEMLPNGAHRMAIHQRRVQVNRPLVIRKEGMVECQVRALPEHRFRSTSTMTVRLLTGWAAPRPVKAWVTLPFVACDIPLMAIFRMLGVETVDRVVRMVVSRGSDAGLTPWVQGHPFTAPEDAALGRWVEDMLRPAAIFKKTRAADAPAAMPVAGDTSSAAAAAWRTPAIPVATACPDFERMGQEEAGAWVMAQQKGQKQYGHDTKWMSTLATETLPQLGVGIGPSALTAKAMFLARMVWMAAVVAREGDPATPHAATAGCMWQEAGVGGPPVALHKGVRPHSRDALGNTYYAMPGWLLALLLRQNMRRQIKAQQMTLRNTPAETAQLSRLLRKRVVTDGVRYATITGNWGERKGNATPSQQDITQQRQAWSVTAQFAHMVGMRTPQRERATPSEARQLHPSTAGFTCPASHTEGKQCGLRHLPAVGARFTRGRDAQYMLPRVSQALYRMHNSGFVPLPFAEVHSGAVAAPPRPQCAGEVEITEQHMVRSARQSQQRALLQHMSQERLAALDGNAREGGAAASDAVTVAAVASMAWPGSAQCVAALGFHRHEWGRMHADCDAHAAAVRTRLPHTAALVMVNGVMVGHVQDGRAAARVLRRMRRTGALPRDVEVAVMDGGTLVWVGAQSGEMRRPLWVCTPSARAVAVEVWRAWRRRRGNPAALWQSMLNARVIEYVGPNEVTNLLIGEHPCRERWEAAARRGVSHMEVHPAAMFSAALACQPFLEHNQGPRNAYAFAMGNAASSEAPGALANETTLTMLASPHRRGVSTVVEQALFPEGIGVGAVILVGVLCAGANVEDSMVMCKEAAEAGVLSLFSVHSYTTEAARGADAWRTDTGRVFARPTAKTLATSTAQYTAPERDGLPRRGVPVRPGDAVVCMQRFAPGKDGAVWHDGSIFTSPRDVPCEVHSVRVSAGGVAGTTQVSVMTMSQCRVSRGDKVAVEPSQKGTISELRPAAHMPVVPGLGRLTLLMNAHAMPSRMTGSKDRAGMVLASALLTGTPSPDGTPWGDGPCSAEWAKGVLVQHGVAWHGHRTVNDGVTGKPMRMEVFAVPQTVLRLRQLASSKINARATGPRDRLTGQAAEGRATSGGQRLGVMETDAIVSAGAAGVLEERTRIAGDGVCVWMCSKCRVAGVPPSPPDVIGASVRATGHVGAPTSIDRLSADSHARCLKCGSGDHMLQVDTRRTFLLFQREQQAGGVSISMDVAPGTSIDALVPPSPIALQRTSAEGHPKTVPVNHMMERFARVTPQDVKEHMARVHTDPRDVQDAASVVDMEASLDVDALGDDEVWADNNALDDTGSVLDMDDMQWGDACLDAEEGVQEWDDGEW